MTATVFADAEALAAGVAAALTQRLRDIQATGRTPRVALTGGRIATRAYELVAADDVDWTNVDFWWGDERFVPDGHPDRNDKQARDAFLNRLGVPAQSIHPMPSHGCDLSMAEAADRYAADLPEEFDLVLLGVGPDGHVASVFPGRPDTESPDIGRLVIEVFDSPKPPAQRLTLTPAALSNTASVWFLAAGTDKAEAVSQGMTGRAKVPVAQVNGHNETTWWLDATASKPS